MHNLSKLAKQHGKFFCLHWILICFILLISAVNTNAQVTANFTADSTEGCGVLELNLINLSSGATSYLWEVFDSGGGLVSSSTLTNPTFFLTTPGDYTVTLTAYGPGGITDVFTITDFAHVYTSPTAVIDAPDLTACIGETLSFTDISLPGSFGSIATRYWVITGAGTLPATPTISYTFPSAGIFTVYLFVADAIGCSAYVTVDVTVNPAPVANFSGDSLVSCFVPHTVNFTNLSTGDAPLTYLWQFGDGSTSTATNPSHTYTSLGTYDVTLIVTNGFGCRDTLAYPSYIILTATALVDFTASPLSICEGGTIVFDNLALSSSGAWLWNFGDGTTSTLFEPTHVYTTAGTYSVTLSVDYGGGCTGTITYPNLITVSPGPTAVFTSTAASSACEIPLTVTFSPSVTGGPVSYLWQFEDAGFTATSAGVSPTYTWSTPGTYDVTLTVENGTGCTYTYYMPDYITIGTLNLTIIPSKDNGCVPLGVNFSATAAEAISTYNWDLGDGTTSTLANPAHSYTNIGCYTVTLNVQSINGCTDTAEYAYICVGDTATANLIIPDTACPGTPIEVYYLPLDSITAVIDGGLSYSTASPVDSVTTINLPPGTHNIDWVTWSYGCPDTISSSIYILDVDDSLLNVIYTCANPYQMQIFIDTAMAAASCGWTWDFGDGDLDSVNMNPIHVYDSAGTYTITVTYDCIAPVPCSGIGRDVEIIVPMPQFSGPQFGCDTPFIATFTNLSTDGVNNDLDYVWDFGDGTASTDVSPTHTYTDFGTYYIILKATDSRGCFDFFRDTLVINELIAGYDSPDFASCAPFTFTLQDTSFSLLGSIVEWIIDWDDSSAVDTFYSAAAVASIDHTFNEEGYYYVTLTAIDEFGCESIYTDTVRATAPNVDFTADDSLPCVNQNIIFTELASGAGLTYLWDFGDGTTSTDANPVHQYATMDSFDVTLTVTDVNGCTSTLTKPLFIKSDSVSGDFDATVLVASCNYSLIQFFSSSPDSICSYYWNFGDGGTSTDPNPIYPYLFAGIYNVSLTLTNCNDCSTTISKTGYIVVPGPFGNVSPSEDTICAGQVLTLYLTVTSTDTATVYLDNGDALNFDITYSDSVPVIIEIPYTYTTAGSYYPTALVVDTSGCINVLNSTDSIRVGNIPEAQYFVPDPTKCVGDIFTFSDSSFSLNPIVNWNWDIGDSLFSIDSSITFNHVYNTAGDYITSLIVETNYGCLDTMNVNVSVLDYPLIAITPDSTICPGQSVQLAATGGITYTWTPSSGLSDTSISNPVSLPDSSTEYIVEVSNGYCSSFDSVLITLVDYLIVDAGPDTIICLADDIQLYSEFITDVDQNNIDFYWSPSTDLNDSTLANPVSSTLVPITYVLYATCGLLNDTADASIDVSAPPDVEIAEDTILIILGQSVYINSVLIGGNPPITYQWQPAGLVDCPTCTSVNSSPDQSTIFSVQVTDEAGCTDIDFVYVKVRACDESLFQIPNIITPNSDGYNDFFKVKYEGISIVKSLRIYDRWGELLFETNNLDIAWDGSYNGVISNPGVYVYAIDVICIDGSESVISGNVTLIK